VAIESDQDAATSEQDRSGLVNGTRLVIIRHGEAWCNFEQFVGGPKSCRGLTPRGVRQAEALRERLRRTGELADASALWTSNLPRAIETTEIVSGALVALDARQSPGLDERDAGEADGLFWREIPERYGRSSTPGDEPHEPLAPGGESWVTFIDRAEAELSRLARSHAGELIVVVAHGGIIDASLIRFLRLPDHGSQVRLHAEHTSITEWQYTGKRWRLVRYNDSSHLHDPVHAGELLAPPPEWVHTER
jgi:probable phosphoglycerate mutase